MNAISEIYIDNSYNWSKRKNEIFVLYGVSHDNSLTKIEKKISKLEAWNSSSIVELFKKQVGNFAGVIETDKYICAFVDKIRSHPVFYSFSEGEIKISNSARVLKEKTGLNKINELSHLEYRMAGYVTGRETIYENLYQLRAGELLYFDKLEKKIKLERYFNYHPATKNDKSDDYYIEKHGEVLDRVFRRVILNAAGAPIWIPLSGGLDSRLIICKLVSMGYDNLHSFTYGARRNHEVEAAKEVAESLGVPWFFVKTSPSKIRNLFFSDSRKDYWEYADGLCSMPTMNDYAALHTLRRKGLLPDDAVIINGQSGDFISGGHISLSLIHGGRSTKELLEAITIKHFSLWNDLKTKHNLKTIESKILSTLDVESDTEFSMDEIASYFEQWEWQERQVKLVVNGQRLYDFLGLKWQLPLWDAELMDFWGTVPLRLRLQQSLFIKYLESYDYNGLFKGYSSEARRWSGLLGMVIPVVQKIGRLFNFDTDIIQKYASYWGHYADQYAFYGLKYFLQNISNATVPPQGRGVIALGTKTWLEENKIK
jgi:asparagine synthase (glutamine-hydrolysing)